VSELGGAGVFERFGPYLLLRPLGKGGMGIVYIARTPRRDPPLAALKRLRPDCRMLPNFAERFRHEGMLALRLAHPNIVATIDVGEIDEVPYVASELILGKDAELIALRSNDAGARIPVEVVLKVLSDALRGLAYAHEAKESDGRPLHLVHRDIAPGNILVGYDGKARIADFGIARSMLTEHLALTKDGVVLGTPKYLAPEMARGEVATQATDLYGLGAVAYLLFAAVPPYDGDTREVISKIALGPPTPLRFLRPDLPAWIPQFIDRLMERDPEARPASASVALREIGSWTKDHVLPTDETVGRWVADLFPLERDRELVEAEALSAIDPRAVATPRTPTRALRMTPEAPFPPWWPTEPLDAPTEAFATARIAKSTAAEDRTAVRPIAPRSKRMLFLAPLLSAFIAGLLGLGAGMKLARPGVVQQAERVGIIERYGAARRAVEDLRRERARIPDDVTEILERVTRAIADERWEDADRALQHLEVELANRPGSQEN
jgi:hypothetical protein